MHVNDGYPTELEMANWCEHFADRAGCVMCGPHQGNVTAVQCARCGAGTWHSNATKSCLKCGSVPLVWESMLDHKKAKTYYFCTLCCNWHRYGTRPCCDNW